MPITFFNQREFMRKYSAVMPQNATYVSATGTAGTNNTDMTVITRTIPAGTMHRVGDRLRTRVYFFSANTSGITATLKLGPANSEITLSATATTGAANTATLESWVHYIDATHANNIDTLGTNDFKNTAGFTWEAEQNLIVNQSATVNNKITVFGIFVDYFPVAP